MRWRASLLASSLMLRSDKRPGLMALNSLLRSASSINLALQLGFGATINMESQASIFSCMCTVNLVWGKGEMEVGTDMLPWQ